MEKSKSESYNTLMEKINPLNLNSFNDNVVALKILLNLCDNDEVRNLGQQILDSYLLLNLLKSNMGIKQYFNEYSDLVKKLHTFINKYMHFEKLIRENDVRTYAFITTNYNEKSTSNEGEAAFDAVQSENSYLVIRHKSDDFKGYSLTAILNDSKIFSSILAKDKEKKFKIEINNDILKNNKRQQKIEYSENVEELISIKKRIFVETITTDDLSDNQVQLFNLIEEEFKELLSLETKILLLEKFIDKLMSRTFVLDSEIAKKYRNFKELCEKDLAISIKLKIELMEKIKTDLTTYESILKSMDINKVEEKETSQKREEKVDKEIIKSLVTFYKDYLVEKINNNELGKIKFSEYVEKIASDQRDVIDYIKEKEVQQQKEYVDYLINKLGSDNPEEYGEFNESTPVFNSYTGKRAA